MKRTFTGGTWHTKNEDVVEFLKSERRKAALKAAAKAVAKTKRDRETEAVQQPAAAAAAGS